MTKTSEIRKETGSAKPAGLSVSARNVSHHFYVNGQKLPVIDDVSFEMEPGSFIALLGPSGCGKSTLLRLVAGLEAPITGSLFADDAPISGPGPERVVAFQDPTLLPWRTVRANVALGLEAQGKMDRAGKALIEENLARVGLSDFASAYPRQLSGGMAQRAALARALVNNPRLLILDEPLGKLDSLTRIRMQREIVSLWREQGFSVLMVTHDVEEAFFMANRVILFSPRPARIVRRFDVALPYPRQRSDPALIALRTQALDLLGTEPRPPDENDVEFVI